MLEKAFESLGAFPLIQAAVACLILMAGYILIPRGERDAKKPPPDAGMIPPFLMMGPAHDAIGAIHEMNEQSRQHIALMEQMVRHLDDVSENTKDAIHAIHQTTAILEMIRNESRLR
jgi:hypothetical protein